MGPDDAQIVAGSFEGLFGVVVRNESGVVIKRHISLPAESLEDGQQAGMFFVHARPDEFDDRDVMPRLAPGAEAMAEHKPQGSLEHRFVGLLEASLLIESENLMGRGELLFSAGEEAVDLRPLDFVRLELFHLEL